MRKDKDGFPEINSKIGRLTWKDAQNPNAPLDKTDIIYRTHIKDEHVDSQVSSLGFMGFMHHGGGIFTTNMHHVATVKNDCYQLHNGGYYCEHQSAWHDAEFTYSPENHSDLFQFFAKNLDWSDAEVFDGLYIGDGNYYSKGKKRNGFLGTEVCQYKNCDFWPNGVKLDSDSKLPYLLDMTNGTNITAGSALFPIDPLQISNKQIRFGTTKKNNPESENIVIHAYEGLKIALGKQEKEATTIRYYKRHWTPQQRQNNWDVFSMGKLLGEWK